MNSLKSGCANCKRKALVKVTCKCQKVLCLTCRQPEDHGCTFDYKDEFQQKLRKENVLVVAEKVVKI